MAARAGAARAGKITVRIFAGALALVLLAAAFVVLLANTPWGREQLRGFLLAQMAEVVEGEVEIGRLEGNLLVAPRVRDVSIIDEEGRPFLEADLLGWRHSLFSLLRRRIVLAEVEVRGARIVLDQPPDEAWNFMRVFGVDPEAEPEEDPDWGKWVEIRDLRIEDTRLTLRTAWEPDEELSPEEREERIRRARAGETRDRIEEVPGGFQTVREFGELHAHATRVLIAHPDVDDVVLEIAELRTVAEPFRAPPGEIMHLSGSVAVGNGVIVLSEIELVLPGSHLAAEAVFSLETGDIFAAVGADPVRLADFRFLEPDLPEDVEGRVRAEIEVRSGVIRAAAQELDLRVADGRVEGRGHVVFGPDILVDETELRLTGLDTRLAEELVPGLELPRHGELSGRIRAGAAEEDGGAIRLDVALEFDDEEDGVSRLLAEGIVDPARELRFSDLHLRFDPLQLEFVRGFAPDVPLRGQVEGGVLVDGPARGPLHLEGALVHRDPQAGTSRIGLAGGLDLRDEEVRLLDLRVDLDEVRLDAVRHEIEVLPAGAVVRGRAHLGGALGGRLDVRGDLTLDDPVSGTSRVLAQGGVRPTDGPAFDALEVDLRPLQVELLHVAVADLALGGLLEGEAVLDGSAERGLSIRADLVHIEDEERSRVLVQGEVATPGEGRVDAEIELRELSLVTVGRLAPEAQLRGDVSGDLRVVGTFAELALSARLELPDEGALELDGDLDVRAEEPGYRVTARLQSLNLEALSGRAPDSTAIEGSVDLSGRGTAPATARASATVALVDRANDEERRLAAEVAVADGLLSADSVVLRLPAAVARAEGTFGLVADRTGEATYDVAVDSLRVLAPYLPEPDTGTVELRTAAAEADAAGRRQEVLEQGGIVPVEDRAAVGRPRVRRDALAGSVQASGRLRGNVESAHVEGILDAADLMAMGHHVGRAEAEYEVRDLGGEAPEAIVVGRAERLLLAGFSYDSLVVRAHLREGEVRTGEALLRVHQDEETQVIADAAFELSDERAEVRLDELLFEFEDAVYRLTAPARVRWSEDEVAVEELRLETEPGALILIDGRLPVDDGAPPGRLELRTAEVDLGHLFTLLQEGEVARGRLDLHLPVEGSLSSPRMEGEASLTLADVDGTPLPDTRVRFRYGDRELAADAAMEWAGRTMLTADALLPIDLGIVREDEGAPRFPDEPIRIEATMDDVALEPFLALTDQVEAAVGRLDGRLLVTGRYDEPLLEGALAFDVPSMFVPEAGILMRDMAGALVLEENVVRIDSLVAYSRGPVRVTGEVDFTRLAAPEFDLLLEARNTQVMDTDDVQARVDAVLQIRGPFEAVEARGDVRVRRAVIRVPETEELAAPGPLNLEDDRLFERVDPALLAARDALIQPTPILENLQVEIQVYLERDVWLRSTEANVEMYTPTEIGPLTVRMTGLGAQDLSLEGTVNTERGEYEFMGRRFDLTRGSILFRPGPDIDPLLRLTAEHEVQMPGREGFDVRIVVEGSLEDLETEFESTAQPPISQTDLLSFVVFGRDAGSLLQVQGSALAGQGSAGGPLVGNVAAMATRQLTAVGLQAVVNEVEVETARALGLDVLHIQPADTPAELSTGELLDVLRATEFHVGRYVTPRLFISGQARPTFVHPGARVEYLTDGEYVWRVTWRPRFLPSIPTLGEPEAERRSVFGILLFREWRF